MNSSRRLILQAAAAATCGFASLRWATATTPATSTNLQELLTFQRNVASRTATCTATLAFANELRANRDDALKRLVGPVFSSRLFELPLSTRATVGNIVFDLVGNSSTAAMKLSPAECDELSERLYTGIVVSGFFIFGTWIDTDIVDVSENRYCGEYHAALLEAIRRCREAYLDYLACEKPKNNAHSDNAQIFPILGWTPENIAYPVADCRNEYNQVMLELYAYQQALQTFNRCLLMITPRG